MNKLNGCKKAIIIGDVILLLILIVLIYLTKMPIFDFIKSWDFSAVVGIFVASAISIYTHRAIVNRDKKINTISQLTKIREQYPNLSCCKAAKCKTPKELFDKRLKYLKEMDFLCVGIRENIYDYNIVKRMSGHMLSTQYKEYMREFAKLRINKGFEYKDYIVVMEKLCRHIEEEDKK